MADFPRLLVATEFPPNASGGGPAVIRQMLKDWPVEKLFWWSCWRENSQRFGQKTAMLRTATIPPRWYPNQRLRRVKSWWMELIWSRWAAGHFRKTLQDCQPEAIWVIPHSWAAAPLAAVLGQGKIPFHATIQDYIDTNERIKQFGIQRSKKLAALADRLYVKATTRDATSHPMIADLRARTHCDAVQMLHAGLEPEDFAYLMAGQGDTLGRIRIAYAGTILVEDVFEKFVAALSMVRQRLKTELVLEFFGAHSYKTRQWFDAAWMTENGNLPEMELAAALRKCTWGFSPMALTDDDPRYNRFSFPTKFISYLAAGLPVITMGHPESSVMKMAGQYRVGVCISANEAPEIARQLLAGFEQMPGDRYRVEIIRCARMEFDAVRMRNRLYTGFKNESRDD